MADIRNNDDSGDGSEEARAPLEPRGVRLLMERFPHIRDMSRQVVECNEAFRDLCEEYEACTEAIQRLAHSGRRAALLNEYRTLRLRLEGELLRFISAHWSEHGPR